jgi:hypothetical protein
LLQQAEAILEEKETKLGENESDIVDSEAETESADSDDENSASSLSEVNLPLASSNSTSNVLNASENNEPEPSSSIESSTANVSPDPWELRFRARELLSRAINLAQSQKARLFEVKALMTIIPLIEFIIREYRGDQSISEPSSSVSANHSIISKDFPNAASYDECTLCECLVLYIQRLRDLVSELEDQSEFIILTEAKEMLVSRSESTNDNESEVTSQKLTIHMEWNQPTAAVV